MKCNECYEQLSAYIDHMLTEKEQTEVEMHLKACPACAEELFHLKVMIEQMDALEEAEVPETLHQDIMKQINNETLHIKKIIPFKKWTTYFAGVAAALLIMVIWFDSNQMGTKSADLSTAQAPEIMKDEATASTQMADAAPAAEATQNQEAGVSMMLKEDNAEESKTADARKRSAENSIVFEEWEIASDNKEAVIQFLKDFSTEHGIQLEFLPDEKDTLSVSVYQIPDKQALSKELSKIDHSLKVITAQQGENVKITFKP